MKHNSYHNIDGDDLVHFHTTHFYDYCEKIQQARNNLKRLRCLRESMLEDPNLNELQEENLKSMIDQKISKEMKRMLLDGKMFPDEE